MHGGYMIRACRICERAAAHRNAVRMWAKKKAARLNK
jgi:hypothetical protein